MIQQDLATKIKIGRARMSAYESGEKPVPRYVAERVADYFGVPLEEIYSPAEYEFKYVLITYVYGREVDRLETNSKKEAREYYSARSDCSCATRIIYCGQKLTYPEGDEFMRYKYNDGTFNFKLRRNARDYEILCSDFNPRRMVESQKK